MKRILAIILCASAVRAQDLDVRHLYTTNDVSCLVTAVAPIKWSKGESVKWDLYLARGGVALDTSSNVTATVQAFDGTNQLLAVNGTVATNGYISFDLTPAQAGLELGTYDLYVTLYSQVAGSNRYNGVAWRSQLQVLAGPDSP